MKYNVLRDTQIMLSSGILYLKAGDYETDNKEVIGKLDKALNVEIVKPKSTKK